MHDTDGDIHFNDHELQESKAQCCGRWVGYRLRQRHKTIDQFLEPFVEAAENYDIEPDELIIKLPILYY